MPAWRSLGVAAAELRVGPTLECGQCFGWAKTAADSQEWIGVIGQHVVGLREGTEEDGVQACCYTGTQRDVTLALRDYFQLETRLVPLYKRWSTADQRMQVCVDGAIS